MTELSAKSRRGVVVAPHFLAVEAGREVLMEGGNALEAAIAAAEQAIKAFSADSAKRFGRWYSQNS